MSKYETTPTGLRYIHACELTEKQREHAIKSDLYQHGDMILVWVNEGDLCDFRLLQEIQSLQKQLQEERYRYMGLQGEKNDLLSLVREARTQLQILYANRGEDKLVSDIINPLLISLEW